MFFCAICIALQCLRAGVENCSDCSVFIYVRCSEPLTIRLLRYLSPGTWYPVPAGSRGTWHPVPVARYLVAGTRYQVPEHLFSKPEDLRRVYLNTCSCSANLCGICHAMSFRAMTRYTVLSETAKVQKMTVAQRSSPKRNCGQRIYGPSTNDLLGVAPTTPRKSTGRSCLSSNAI